MSFWWFAVAASLAAADASTTAVTSLHGTTRLGTRPEPHAVVWLDTTGTDRALGRRRNRARSAESGLFAQHPGRPGGHDGRVSQSRPRLPQRVLVPRREEVRPRPLSGGHAPQGDVRSARLSRIFCNIHPNMAAYVMAVATPYFGLSDGRGPLRDRVGPPGSYTYHSWRPGRPELTGHRRRRSGSHARRAVAMSAARPRSSARAW